MLPGTCGTSAALSTIVPGTQGTSLPTHDARACRYTRRIDMPRSLAIGFLDNQRPTFGGQYVHELAELAGKNL